MGKHKEKLMKDMKNSLKWIFWISVGPLAFLLCMLMASYNLLRFLYKVLLLFIIVVINTPFAVMYNVSIVVLQYNFAYYWDFNSTKSSTKSQWNWSDPRAQVGIEVKLIVNDFLKVVANELLLLVSTGIITFYTAPRMVFYISTAIWVIAIIHKWLNTKCLSKTSLSCLCDAYGLSPMTFLFSFIGLFDIGCHPIAKCSFLASQAFLFVKEFPKNIKIEVPSKDSGSEGVQEYHVISKHDIEQVPSKSEPTTTYMEPKERLQVAPNIEPTTTYMQPKELRPTTYMQPKERQPTTYIVPMECLRVAPNMDDAKPKPKWYQFNEKKITLEEQSIKFLKWEIKTGRKQISIEFPKRNVFQSGIFQLYPRIDFIKESHGKYVLESFMVLKLLKKKKLKCEYPVERLELPEYYSKPKQLLNFLQALAKEDGFVTDKMRGRYELSLMLLEIAEGVEENIGYKTMEPIDKWFVVAGCNNDEYGK